LAFPRVGEAAPLVRAVNRAEADARPASPPKWIAGDPRVLAPRDEREGGTWMGATEVGLWVGLTNRHEGDLDPERRSRGRLCLDLLRGGESPHAVVDRIGALEEPYNPFHLVTGDGRSLWRVAYDGGVVEARELSAGCHLVTNRPTGEEDEEPKVARARALLEAAGLWPIPPGGGAPADLEDRLAAILADHGHRGPDAVCLHGGRYGTRSAAVWRIRPHAPDGDPGIGLAFAAGPPCSAAFERISFPNDAGR
ncbi:MAG: NRDE family protein, partial [Gemmatimonadota bacterium]|nr:NRDE family protein [Gemmatimonadota bacterium]